MFYSYLLPQYQKQTIKMYRFLYRALLFNSLLFKWYWLIVGNSVTPFKKVTATYCNNCYYNLINLTDFILITFYWFSMLEFISITKLRNNT